MIHFTHDYEAGVKDERERIIKLLEAQAIYPSDWEHYQDLIILIKGEKQ